MNKRHFKASPCFSATKNTNVDKENGILKNVEIAKFGKNKNYSYFDDTFLNDLVIKGNEQTQGVKSRFGHPNMCATSLGTYIGRYKEFTRVDNKVYANLYLDEISKKTQVEGKGISMYDYIIDMAENNPDMFGNSIVINCDYTKIELEDDSGKKEKIQSLILTEFLASDLVDDPAATDALFSSNPDDLGIIITEFLDENPKIFDVINKKPEMIADFFERYYNYQSRKSNNLNMNKFSRSIAKMLGMSFDIDTTLADGTIVKVKTEAETPQEGDEVTDEAGNAVPDDTHVLADGSSITTVGGKITEITPKPEENPPAEPTMTDVMNSVSTLSKAFNSLKKDVESYQKENEKTMMLFASKVKKLGEAIKSEEFEVDENEDEPSKNFKSGYDPEKAKELRDKRKKNN